MKAHKNESESNSKLNDRVFSIPQNWPENLKAAYGINDLEIESKPPKKKKKTNLVKNKRSTSLSNNVPSNPFDQTGKP